MNISWLVYDVIALVLRILFLTRIHTLSNDNICVIFRKLYRTILLACRFSRLSVCHTYISSMPDLNDVFSRVILVCLCVYVKFKMIYAL